MQVHYRGHEVVDPNRHLIGTISDVLHDGEGQPEWAIVDLGLFRSAHYMPIQTGYLADDGAFVVPFDKKVVKAAPKANRAHVLEPTIEREVLEHYGVSH